MSTIEVPPALPEIPELPGDAASVETFADELLRASTTLDDLDTTATTTSTIDGWSGDASDGYARHVRSVATDAGTMSLTLRAVARAAQGYGDELLRLEAVRNLLETDAQDYASRRSTLLADIAAGTEDDVPELRARAEALARTEAAVASDIAAWQRDVEANDTDMLDALARYATLELARQETSGGDPADAAMTRPGAPGSGATPEQVAAWWDGLSEDERLAVIAANPELIGSADGLPADVRDQANRILLDNDLEALEGLEAEGTYLHPDQQRRLDNARAAQAALEDADAWTDPITNEKPGGLLHLYDPTAFGGDGTIAIAVGNPDTADNVSTLVPGIGTDGTSAGTYTEAAGNLYDSARLSDPGSTTAVLMWIGYDHPSGPGDVHTYGSGNAEAGGERLAQYVSGLQATRGDDQPHMTVIGHSYGSVTMSYAATDHGLGDMVDDLVYIGSPGAGSAGSASDLGSATVWAGNASRDPVVMTANNGWINAGGLSQGRDVGEDTFGAIRFQAEHPDRNLGDLEDQPSQGDILISGLATGAADHSRYWTPGSESLFNLGQIIVDDDDEVLRAGYVHDPWYAGPQDPEWGRTPTPIDPNRGPDR
ncbi:MAG: hypothetical protein J0H73_07600 [Salana multivorans]|uniref:alpha/beta hydrolase n=1 Tax=Salana multivorans TaxID=120377 RepID=UPI00096348AE|nr:alpha/beta hydrolase [Salana multivorans]MBN8882162.1 hypothetical protein [Salana multivorans]OJX97304.1 MAG: hypothetical protein BGO96_05010 [Micrococcales bacterium 73-15]